MDGSMLRTGVTAADDDASGLSRADLARDLVRERRSHLLRDTAERLLRGEDPDATVLPMLYRALAAERIVDASLGFVVTHAEASMELGFIKGFPERMMKSLLTLDFGQAVCGTVAATRQAMHVTNIQQSTDPLADLVRSAGMTAYACEPLIVGDRLLGTLSFASRTRPSFDPEDLQFFRAIAKHVARARDRAANRSNRAAHGDGAPETRAVAGELDRAKSA